MVLRTEEIESSPKFDMKECTSPSFQNDAYNLRFYKSEKRKKYSTYYGLPDSHFQRSELPKSIGVIQSILNNFEVGDYRIEYQKSDWVTIAN